MSVRVTFEYEPEKLDEKQPTLITDDEYMRLVRGLAALGARNVEFEQAVIRVPGGVAA